MFRMIFGGVMKRLSSSEKAFCITFAGIGVIWIALLVIGAEYQNWSIMGVGLFCFAIFWILLLFEICHRKVCS